MMAASDNTIKNFQLLNVGRWKAICYDTPGKNGAPRLTCCWFTPTRVGISFSVAGPILITAAKT